MEFKVEGLTKLTAVLEEKEKKFKGDIKKTIETNSRRMQDAVQAEAQFGRFAKKPTTTGNLRSSIRTTIKDGGMTSVTEPHTDYASYVEYGTRKMAAQPYVRPAFDKVSEQFKDDLDKLMK